MRYDEPLNWTRSSRDHGVQDTRHILTCRMLRQNNKKREDEKDRRAKEEEVKPTYNDWMEK